MCFLKNSYLGYYESTDNFKILTFKTMTGKGSFFKIGVSQIKKIL
jgi:hypothetical protein